MKTYKLKKNTPDFRAGEIFTMDKSGTMIPEGSHMAE